MSSVIVTCPNCRKQQPVEAVIPPEGLRHECAHCRSPFKVKLPPAAAAPPPPPPMPAFPAVPSARRTLFHGVQRPGGASLGLDLGSGDLPAAREDMPLPGDLPAPRGDIPMPGDLPAPRESMPLPDDFLAPRESVPRPDDLLAPRDSIPLPDDFLAPRESVPRPDDLLAPRDSMPLPDDLLSPLEGIGGKPTDQKSARPIS